MVFFVLNGLAKDKGRFIKNKLNAIITFEDEVFTSNKKVMFFEKHGFFLSTFVALLP